MPRTLRALACFLFACSAVPMAHAEESEALQPYQMVRSLQLVQDRIADGDHAALPMQKKLLELIDARFRAAAAEDFADRRNYRSMLIYAMSGGNPVTLEVVKSRLTLEHNDAAMVDAILAYLNGSTRKARDAFAAVDPMAQTADLGAFLALVKGSLAAVDDPPGAIAMFDKARLLAPGTLVEEAALRRSVALVTQVGDAKKFTQWSSEYVRRFLRSPYASQFADAFVSGVVALHASIDFHAVEDVIAGMQAEQRKVIYLRLARRGAIEGLADVAAFAAAHVEDKGEEVSENDPRALLYASLSDVRSGNLEDVLARLKTIDRSRLSEHDRQLLDAVRSVASQVTAPAEPPPATPMEEPEAAGTEQAKTAEDLARAEEAARAEGPLPDLVPEADPAPDSARAASEGKPPPAGAEAPPPPAADGATAAASAGDSSAEHQPAIEVAAGTPDAATDAAAAAAAGARAKLDAIDKLLEENAGK